MPAAVDAREDADEKVPHSNENSPDLVGEELGDSAQIWRVYDRVSRTEDSERTENWNRGLDNLALFAGLFSAVTTAFIIELKQDTEPDYARLTFLVLNATAAGVPFREEPFVIDPSVRLTNCLWIASLILSLTAALIAIMGKDWIGTYASRPVCNPRQWAEIRTYRLACVKRWYMSGLIASAPVLLHISLALFAAGLVIFVSPDPFSQRVALGLALAAGGLYLVTVISAIVFPTSPFKSPATRAVRSAIVSVSVSLYDLVYSPRRRPIALLQQATVAISAALSYPLPVDVLPPGHFQRRRPSLGSIRMFWNRVFSRHAADQARAWRHTAAAALVQLTAFALSLPTLLRSARDEYRYRSQRPRARQWRASAKSCLRRFSTALSHMRGIDLSDRWAEVRGQPTPDLLAQSLSHLNEMTQSTEVLQSVLTALGDIVIGRQVAPLVSFDLKSRLDAEIRHNWPNVDLVTLSRYILADLHLSDTPRIPGRVLGRFTNGKPIRSESITFALVELPSAYLVRASTITNYLPAVVTQPRGLWYLLPRVKDYPTAIMLAHGYRDHLRTDQYMNLDKELLRLLQSWAGRHGSGELDRHSEGRAGLIELLVIALEYGVLDRLTRTCALILKFLDGEEHPCILGPFGHHDPTIADAAWSALPSHPAAPQDDYSRLGLALPLDQFVPRRWAKGVRPVSKKQGDDEACLARAIVRLLCPSRYFWCAWRKSGWSIVSTLELCVRCLHTQLRHHGGTLDEPNQSTIITLMLEKLVLIRVSTLHSYILDEATMPTAERDVINILTAIARRLDALLGSGETDDYDTGAKLFCMFSFSQVEDYKGQVVAWDLRSYLRDVQGRHPEQAPGKGILSVRRLILVLRRLRPLCAPREDLRVAWERIGLSPDDDYHESFWDARDFELGPLLDSDVHIASLDGASSHENTTPPAVPEEWTALHWLDAAMR